MNVVALRVCFVCTGNICRSPMAEVVLAHEAAVLGLAEQLAIDSAGTAAEVGMDIDRRARNALERRGYEPHRHLARQFDATWLAQREIVIALDRGHVRWLRSRARAPEETERVRLLLAYAKGPGRRPRPHPVDLASAGALLDVPDPYFGGEGVFESCLDLVQAGCAGLLSELAAELAPGPRSLRSPGSPSSC
jgi:protein-tyrosine phosphatase